jgi:hypothetical protein
MLSVVGCGSGSSGNSTTYNITLAKASETPPCTGAGATATGSATLTIDSANTMLTVSNFTYSGLSGATTAAHVHLGTAGNAGPVIFSFGQGAALNSPITKTFTASDYPTAPTPDEPANFGLFMTTIKSGGAYMNVHTAACGGGEIRGQIQ